MTPKERDLTEAAALRLLENRTHAAVLTALLAANGRILSVHQIAFVRPSRAESSHNTENMGKVRICLMRKSLDDVGLCGVVEHIQKTGYRIPLAARARVMACLADFSS